MNKKDKFPFDIELAYSKILNRFVEEIEKKFKEIFLGKENSIDDENYKELEKEFLDYFADLVTVDYAFDMCSDIIFETVEYTISMINAEAVEIVGVNFFEQAFYNEETIQNLLEESISLIKQSLKSI